MTEILLSLLVFLLPACVILWAIVVVFSFLYRKRFKSEFLEEYEELFPQGPWEFRGSLRFRRFIKKREYVDFGDEAFIKYSDRYRMTEKVWDVVFVSTILAVLLFFTTA